jgi:indole-3-glycerol phosphate synthase/phosphoribosylanthranilate isomerase
MLETIVAEKRREVAAREARRPGRSFQDALRPSTRSLAAALRRGRTGFILECKRAAPSAGVLRPDLDVASAVRAYAAHGDAVSVLTDAARFAGSTDDLTIAAQAADVPVLAKDFIVSRYQVEEARLHGADAVLLMLSVLDDAQWGVCHAAARRLGMDALTEVHDEAELTRALALDAAIIGINNRDLRTMRVDLAVTERLAPLVGDGRLVVAESGITSHRDVVRLRGRVDAFLVGTALMRSGNLARAVREVIYGVTKICGLTSVADARAAEAAGATHGGLVFAEESPRRVSLGQARGIRSGTDLAWVGVFVNESASNVALHARELGLAAVQLHGEESAEYVAMLRPQLPAGCEVWKSARVGSLPPPIASTGADRLLLEAGVSGSGPRGGTGRTFDWGRLKYYGDASRCLVAGGLTPTNAAAADRLDVWGLDVSSGVEERPGVKSQAKLAAFLGARRGRGRDAGAR